MCSFTYKIPKRVHGSKDKGHLCLVLLIVQTLAGHVKRMAEMRNLFGILVGIPEREGLKLKTFSWLRIQSSGGHLS